MDQTQQPLAEIPQEVKTFLEGVLFDAKMLTDDKDFNAILVDELFARLIEFINTKIVTEMPEDKLDGFNALLEKDASQEEVDEYIKQSIPAVEKVYDQLFLEFADMYIGRGAYKDIEASEAVVKVKNTQ